MIAITPFVGDTSVPPTTTRSFPRAAARPGSTDGPRLSSETPRGPPDRRSVPGAGAVLGALVAAVAAPDAEAKPAGRAEVGDAVRGPRRRVHALEPVERAGAEVPA